MEDEGLDNYRLWSTWNRRGGNGLGGRNGIGGGKRGSIFHQGAAEPPNGDSGGGGSSPPNILFWGDGDYATDDALGGSGLIHYGGGGGTSSSISSRNIPIGRGNDGGHDMIDGSSNINNGDVIADNSSSNHIQIYDPTADPRHEQLRPRPPTTPAQHQVDSNASQKNMIIVGVLIALIIVLCCILMFIVIPPVIKFFRKKIPVSKKRIERRYRTIDGWLITKAVQPCDDVCQCLQNHYGSNSNNSRRTNRSATTVVATSSKKTEGEDVDAAVESTDAIEVSYKSPDDGRNDRNDNAVASDENVEVIVSGQSQKDDPFENGLLKSSDWLCKLGITQNGKILNGGDTNSNKDGTIKCRDTKESKNQDMQKPCNCTKHIPQTSKIIKHDGDVKNTNYDCCHAGDEDICDGNRSVSSSSSSSSALSSLSKPCCSICLESFRIGDTISWSTSSACPHVYHHACIREWLLRKVGCPYCRVVVFLPVDRPTEADNTSAGGDGEGGGSQPAFRRRPLTDEALGKLAAERAFRATTTYFCGDCGLVELNGFGDDHWERIRGFTNKGNNQKSKQDNNNPVKASLRRGRGVLSTFLPFFSSTDRHRRLPNVEDDRNHVDSRIQQDNRNYEIDGNLSVNDQSERDLLHDLEDPSSRGENDDRDQEAASSHEHHHESLPICHVPLVQSPSASTNWSTTPMSVLRSTTTTTEVSHSTSSSSSPSSYGVNTTTSTVESPVPYEQSSSFTSSFNTDSSPPALVMGETIEAVSSTIDNILSRPAGGSVSSSSGNDAPASTKRGTRNIEHDTDANADLTLPNLDGRDDNVPIIGLLQPRMSPHQ
mmetsp:Transcript_58376/g.142763  ORF Transcript_58376/g.142763 Transcript_58376/m.142763 type:complete len:826 (-) Transcript_58376:34-2511(-)